jgi:DMSO/TMAO reductase YedYZ molybdopterin-dependent catalytic subunit/mono/diheme cytochrome c family protein
MLDFPRRTLLKAMVLSGAVGALRPLSSWAATTGVLPELPAGKFAGDFLLHSELPLALETRRSSFGFGPLTSTSRLFVRNNLPMPPAGINDVPDNWELEVVGTTRTEKLSVRELKSLDIASVATVLQCSGNGRAFFAHNPSGSPWELGAAGCILWTGVPVSAVIEHLGGPENTEANFLTALGGEVLPPGVNPEDVAVERSVPLKKGLQDCLLAWEMNGQPLSLVHGGPLRLIVPGYFGVNNVKWVRRLALTQEQSGARIQQSGYRLRPIGETVSSKDPSMWRMPVKSWLNGPGADGKPVLRGSAVLYGVAFSGERGVTKVEVSGDEGSSWNEASFIGPDLGPNAWRAFIMPVELAIGQQRFVSRAIDADGDSQPRERSENDRGYGHNGWLDAALAITVVEQLPKQLEPSVTTTDAGALEPAIVSVTNTVELSAAALAGKALYTNGTQPDCGVCHSLADAGSTGAVGPDLDSLKPSLSQLQGAIKNGVGVMPAFGGQLSAEEIDALAAYVHETTR